MTARTVLYGAAHRVLLGAVRLAVEENSVSRDHVVAGGVASDGSPAVYLARHRFGRIAAFEQTGLRR